MITLINVFLADRVIAERCGVEAVEHCYPNRPIPVRGQLHERVIVTCALASGRPSNLQCSDLHTDLPVLYIFSTSGRTSSCHFQESQILPSIFLIL